MPEPEEIKEDNKPVPGIMKEPAPENRNVVLPMIFIIIGVLALMLVLVLDNFIPNTKFIVSIVSLAINLAGLVLSFVFVFRRSYDKTSRWMFLILLIVSLFLIVGSLVCLTGNTPGGMSI